MLNDLNPLGFHRLKGVFDDQGFYPIQFVYRVICPYYIMHCSRPDVWSDTLNCCSQQDHNRLGPTLEHKETYSQSYEVGSVAN